jgi:ABC-2 type transport system permease protein
VAAEAFAPAAGGGFASNQLAAPKLFQQVSAVARRSVTRTLRQRALLVFPLLFPLILFAINGSALSAATRIRGFPVGSYRDFALALPFIQGALFVAITAGTDLARDIETGFFNRLALTPLRGTALLIGQLGGAFVIACVQSISPSGSEAVRPCRAFFRCCS